LKPLALKISTSHDHRYGLATLDALDTALFITEQLPEPENKIKWKAVGDRTLFGWKFATPKPSYGHNGEVGALFMLDLTTVNANAVKEDD